MSNPGSPPIKRYRRTDLEENQSEDEEFKTDQETYIPVRERRKKKLVELGQVQEVKANVAETKEV